MGFNEIKRKFSLAGKYLEPLANTYSKLFTEEYIVVKGRVEKIGIMESSATTYTDTRSRTVGVVGRGGVFGALGSSNSTTSTHVLNSISFIKIGAKSLPNVYIPNSGFFEIMKLGDEIGVVLSDNENWVAYINNFNEGLSIGERPSFAAKMLKPYLLFFAVITAIFFIEVSIGALINKLDLFNIIVATFFAIFFYCLYRGCCIGLSKSIENWDSAILHANSR